VRRNLPDKHRPYSVTDGDSDGRRLAGLKIGDAIKRGFPTPSGKLEFFSQTLKDWGGPSMHFNLLQESRSS